ncbi:MAG: group I intron-associated PD-(D/E)XK endonuclease [Bacteroidia bacterium]|nr:group I intron-associated PD-(D/E)XK endonuclease [Bacteroidia bacterium]
MNTKAIGNIGEAKVICKFVELGIPVYIPFGDNERADLIAEFNEKLNKIQVKTSLKAEDGKYIISLTSSTEHRKNGVRHVYSEKDIDYFALYNMTRDKVLLIAVNDAPNTAITVRYEKPKTNNQYNPWLEEKLLLEKVLCVETLHDAPEQLDEGEDKVQTTM